MLLLVSNLLLWEHVASIPTLTVSTEDLYNRVVDQSHSTYYMAADIYHEFTEDLLKTMINISHAWEEPLKHLISAVPTLQKASGKMLKTANALKDRIHVLMEGIEIILSRIQNGQNEVEKDAYPAWSGLEDLNSSDEDTHLFAFYTLTEDLLKTMINISHAWEEPMKHLISAVPTLQKASDKMLKTANALKDRIHVLMEGIEIILSRSQNEVEKDVYPAWSGLKDLNSSDEDTHLFAFYTLLFYCSSYDFVNGIEQTEVLLKVIINVSNAWKYPLKLLTPAVLTHLGSYDGMLARAVEVNYGNEAILEGAKVLLNRSEDLLKVTISVLQAWEEPLKDMVAAVAALPGASDVMLSRTKELEERILGLLEGLKTILSRVQPGTVENYHTFWSGWPDLQSSDEDTRNIAFYTLVRCVRRDTHKIDNYLKILILSGNFYSLKLCSPQMFCDIKFTMHDLLSWKSLRKKQQNR
ncbi:hypothetical protein STEG23_000812, partial [Scotinomys teguina]